MKRTKSILKKVCFVIIIFIMLLFNKAYGVMLPYTKILLNIEDLPKDSNLYMLILDNEDGKSIVKNIANTLHYNTQEDAYYSASKELEQIMRDIDAGKELDKEYETSEYNQIKKYMGKEEYNNNVYMKFLLEVQNSTIDISFVNLTMQTHGEYLSTDNIIFKINDEEIITIDSSKGVTESWCTTFEMKYNYYSNKISYAHDEIINNYFIKPLLIFFLIKIIISMFFMKLNTKNILTVALTNAISTSILGLVFFNLWKIIKIYLGGSFEFFAFAFAFTFLTLIIEKKIYQAKLENTDETKLKKWQQINIVFIVLFLVIFSSNIILVRIL